jgi:hypothetical protein
MNNLTPFHLYELATSSVSSFLKAQYNNIFQDPNKALNNLFTDFTKKIDKEKNISNLYQRFIKSNQTVVQNEINNAETIDAINKIITDNIKYFYFSLKPVVNKLQNDEFTMEKIFERSRDKRLQVLMSYPEDQFSNGVTQYISDGVLPWIKKDAGLDKQEDKQQTQEPNKPTSERIMYNIYKILEADDVNQVTPDVDLVSYKKSAIKWINMSLFDLLKPKIQILNKIGSANTGVAVDQASKAMKGTTNDNAKDAILNKIMNMEKEELQKLTEYLGLKDLGNL